MAYIGDGPANTVLIGTSGNTNQFSPDPTMTGSITTNGTINNGFVVMHYVSVASSPYVALSSDYYIGVDSTLGSITVQLPNAPVTGRMFLIKDSAGTSSSNLITITTVGGIVLIDGATSYDINMNYQSNLLVFNGTSYEIC